MTRKEVDAFILEGLDLASENEIETFKKAIKDFDNRTKFTIAAVIDDELDDWKDRNDSKYHRLASFCHKLMALDWIDNNYEAEKTIKDFITEYIGTIVDDYGDVVKPYVYVEISNFTAEKLYLTYILLNENLKNKILKQ